MLPMLHIQYLSDVVFAPQLADLINRAYRDSDGDRRWTTEKHLVDGPRIGQEDVIALMREADSAMLAGFEADELVCCLSLKRMGDILEFGTFAVAPPRQGRGLGKQLLAYAEQVSQTGIRCYQVAVVNRNESLIHFYQKQGYRLNGEILPYPATLTNRPKVDGLALVVLQKPVLNIQMSHQT